MSAPSTPGPNPAVIREFRAAAGLTQSQAAALVYSTKNAWYLWEKGDRAMPYAIWELFSIKAQAIQP